MASLRRSIFVTVLFTLFGGPGIVLVFLPLAITRFHLPAGHGFALRLASILLIALGLIPLLESIARFVRIGRGTLMPAVPTERLVVSGLYRYVRNPMYVGDLVVLAGEALLFQSIPMVLYAVLTWLGFDLFIRRYEEPTLTRRHPGEYPLYLQNVPRWLPRVTPWTGR